MMNCIEVNAIRAADIGRIQEVIGLLKQVQYTGGKIPEMRMKLYTRSDLQGDVSVYLFHDHADQYPGKAGWAIPWRIY